MLSAAEHRTSRVTAPHRQGRTSKIEHDGHGPLWHGEEQTCSQPARGRMQIDVQVGTASVHADRVSRALGGKNAAEDGSIACFPQGQ